MEHDDNGTELIWFPDIQGAHTFGDDVLDALRHAVDSLVSAVDFFVRHNEDIPLASQPKPDQHTVTLPPLEATKVSIYMEMRRQGVTKAELARRLGQDPKQVDRLLDVLHASRHDQLDKALAALGKRIEIVVRDAA
jgi:antitoxin HicB